MPKIKGKLEKTWEKEYYNTFLIRASMNEKYSCGIVEIIEKYEKDKGGWVIGYWELDKEGVPFLKSVGDRIVTAGYHSDSHLLELLEWGQKLAELITKDE